MKRKLTRKNKRLNMKRKEQPRKEKKNYLKRQKKEMGNI